MGDVEPGVRPCCRDLLRVGEAQVYATEVVLQLHLVDLDVTPDRHEHGFRVRLVEDGLERLRLRHAQVHGQVCDGGDAGCVHQFQRERLGLQCRGDDGRCALHVRGVAGLLAVEDDVLAALRRHDELVRVLAADRAAVGLDLDGGQPAAAEDVAVRLAHPLVGDVQPFWPRVEGVGVLHGELAPAEQPRSRARLVPELGLYLVDGERQVPVRLDVRPGDGRHDLLVRRREHHAALAPVGEAEEVVAERGGAARLLPRFDGLERGHEHFLPSGCVHLLPDDPFDLLDGTQRQRQVRVHPCGGLQHHARAEHEPVAHRLRLAGVLS